MIRPVKPESDAAEIAVLIKKSFRPWLDADNIAYLDNLREAGIDAEKHPLWTGITGFPYDLSGVVCTDNAGKIVGIINANQFSLNGSSCCLVSNVCVDPKYRGQGIASRMLHEIERLQRKKGVWGAYLQVRTENPKTVALYKKSGYRITDLRETWIRPEKVHETDTKSSILRVSHVPASDEVKFQEMFDRYYPRSILWNLGYRRDLFTPGRQADIISRLSSRVNRFFRVTGEDGNTEAWAAMQQFNGETDLFWFVPAEDLPEEEFSMILKLCINEYRGKKPLKLDLPAPAPGKIIQEAGFTRQQTVAWMWKRL